MLSIIAEKKASLMPLEPHAASLSVSRFAITLSRPDVVNAEETSTLFLGVVYERNLMWT